MPRAPEQPYVNQPGYLEPTGEPSPYSIAGIFGPNRPSPLVLTNHPSSLEMGARTFASPDGYQTGIASVVEPMSGVQTVDLPGAGDGIRHYQPHAKNLLKPMHSEALWVLVLVLAALGIFSFGIKVGPVRAAVGNV